LVVSNIAASYDDASKRTEVFKSVSFEVKAGDILGVFGPNGSGKTTLVRVIAGLKPPGEGTVDLPGKDGGPPTVATIPQDYRSSFFEWANLQHNLALTSVSVPAHPRKAMGTIDDVRTEMGLDLDLSLRPRRCSGGMLQQAAIIRAFENNPSLILADEPFSALDVNVAATVRASFCRMVRNRGIAAVVVLHQLQDLLEVSDEVLVIPGRPFSTESVPGFEHACILKNEVLPPAQRTEGRLAFMTLAQRLLAGTS
jgi:NitT/TauT family transport system ATP-binding protein